MKFNITEMEGDFNMLDPTRMESFFRCFRIKVTTVVSLLDWTGIITSVLAIFLGIRISSYVIQLLHLILMIIFYSIDI